jgi:hypothetical protein
MEREKCGPVSSRFDGDTSVHTDILETLVGCYFPLRAYLVGRDTGFRSFADQAV